MIRVGVLKDVAYGAKTGGGTVAGMEEVTELANGAMAVFSTKGTLLAADGLNVVAALGDEKEVIIAFGRNETPLLVNVPRQIKYLNRANYRDSVKPIIRVGGTAAATALPLENEGEAGVRVSDASFTSRYSIPAIRASVYKTASMTAEQLIDRIVDKLNKGIAFGGVTATKVGSSPNFGIDITPKEDVAIHVSLYGMFAGGSIEQTTDAVYAIGKGEDVAQMEFEASVEEGNQAFIERTDAWFKGTLQTDASSGYDIITIGYDAWHQGPTTKRHVMDKALSIASPEDAATFDIADALAILENVFPNYASATEGQEIATDDGTDFDGVAGN